MEELLPYYERELLALRKYSREFSDQFPKIAGRLQLTDDVCADPHVERLIEAFAFLTARISRRIDDGYPEFTEQLLDGLYPHYLRPFPSCSIARFEAPANGRVEGKPQTLAAGTELVSRPVRGVRCRFVTTYSVSLDRTAIETVRFAPIGAVAANGAGLSSAQSVLSFQLSWQRAENGDSQPSKIRVFIDGEPSLRSRARDLLALSVQAAYVERPQDAGRWTQLAGIPVSFAGFEAGDDLVPFGPQSNDAYRLLLEYFCFPEKFGFFDFDLDLIAGADDMSRCWLHLVLDVTPDDSSDIRLLSKLSADNFRLRCTPVVNLFQMKGEPIIVDDRQVSHAVVADQRRPSAYDVHSIESVHRLRRSDAGQSAEWVRPLHSVRDGESGTADGRPSWVARRSEAGNLSGSGYEVELTILDPASRAADSYTDTLSLALRCTNRALPCDLSFGSVSGDLSIEGRAPAAQVTMLRKPSPPRRFVGGKESQWRLVAHVSANPRLLLDGGLDGLRQILSLYDLSGSASTRQLIHGVTAAESRPATAWVQGPVFPSLVRGREYRVSIDEDHFVGIGVSAFIDVLDRFLGSYTAANSFIQLVVLSSGDEREIKRCRRRCGSALLQ